MHPSFIPTFRRTAVWLVFAGLLAMQPLVSPVRAQLDESAAEPPNVILIITDDQGYGDVGYHGNTMIQTPHLDVLARESIRLTDFHVDPTCAETRSALMTGRYSSRVGVWHTIMGRSILPAAEVTLAEMFREGGYSTGMFGKWHLGDCFPFRPFEQGFDETLAHGGGGVGQTPDFWANDYFDDTYFLNGRPEPQAGYCTDVWFEGALDFIERHRARPFFCYIATNAPHGPYLVDPRYSDPYLEAGVRRPMAQFYGMITNIDENIGLLRERLREWELDENTLLIFMTDNGTAAGVARDGAWRGFDAGMRGRKGSQYEGGHRVPCFLHWPAGTEQGPRDVDCLTAHFDLLPTLAAVCNLTPHSADLDGIDLSPMFSGDEETLPDRVLFVHSQRVDHPEKWRKCSVMHGRFRLVDGNELYDLDADPGERQDLAGSQPQRVARMRQAYEDWWSDIAESFDDYVRIPLGDPRANPTSFTCHDWHGGSVPWNQRMVQQMLPANGVWAVEVLEAGRYEFTLRARPDGVPWEFQEGTATVRVGEVRRTVELPPGSSSASLRLDLTAGPSMLETTIRESERGERGAYYVEVQRLGTGEEQEEE